MIHKKLFLLNRYLHPLCSDGLCCHELNTNTALIEKIYKRNDRRHMLIVLVESFLSWFSHVIADLSQSLFLHSTEL